jgi:hypothetical protein
MTTEQGNLELSAHAPTIHDTRRCKSSGFLTRGCVLLRCEPSGVGVRPG